MTPDPEADPGEESLEDLPPSAKLVAKSIQYVGPQTQKELAAETLLPARTVRYALDRLEGAGVVRSETVMTDARQNRYHLAADVSTAAEREEVSAGD